MDEVDQQYLDEIIKSTGGEEMSKVNDVKVKEDVITDEDLAVSKIAH